MTYDAPQPESSARPAPEIPAGSTGDAASSLASGAPLLIDCDTCRVRGIGCGDCAVTVLLGGPPSGVSLNDEERRAVEVLAAAGLVPPLRLVDGVQTQEVETA